ncbi:hypothetical protein [uncultured Pelagimonas sp.]|uniref:M10 family metallopeptidase C-terminal domain-containing protein n=1 Tax=uncultured Pelagimonas sp. TaxID=1618102 RepID=UPI00262CD227|nr:hypothetical protein [uncultured Pelagimonas sp.]
MSIQPHINLSLQAQSLVQSGATALDVGLDSVCFVETDQGVFLITTSGRWGGLCSYRLESNGNWRMQDMAFFTGALNHNPVETLAVHNLPDGPVALVSGDEDGIWCFDIDDNGNIGRQDRLSPEDAASFVTTATTQEKTASLVRQVGLGDLTLPDELPDSYGQILSPLSHGGNTYVIVADQNSHEMAALLVDPETGTTHLSAQLGAEQGLGVATPTAMESIQINGRTFVVMAAAGSSSLSVVELTESGNLVLVDHQIDTRETRFGQVVALSVVEVDGQVMVLAGGGDDGVSLFTLMPDGQLIWRDTAIDTLTTSLHNISGIDAQASDGTVYVAISSQRDTGVSMFTLDASNLGEVWQHSSDTTAVNHLGTSGDDILVAGIHGDTLRGGAGDDILEAGPGRTVLQGGAGADVFVLGATSDNARITDFTVGIDRLDLSQWPMLRGPDSLQVTATSTGARIEYRDYTLSIQSSTSRPMNGEDLFGTRFMWADRMMISVGDAEHDADPGQVLRAPSGGASLSGSAWSDRLYGSAGRDTLNGADGDDLLVGGSNQDRVNGGDGDDTMQGGRGDDLWRRQSARR